MGNAVARRCGLWDQLTLSNGQAQCLTAPGTAQNEGVSRFASITSFVALQ